MAAAKNASWSVVAVAPSPATSGLTLTVSSGHGSRFAVGRPAILYPSGEAPLGDNFEIVDVTDITGDVLTIVRTQESTAARTVLVGDQIAQTFTAGEMTRLESAISALQAAWAQVSVPASSTAAGTVNQWAVDDSYLYLCVATNTWRRLPISDWS